RSVGAGIPALGSILRRAAMVTHVPATPDLRPMPPLPRLIDLHCDWLLQYAGEATVFDPAFYPEIAALDRRGKTYFGQAEGYLQATSASVLACYRHPDEWARQADPWRAIGDLLAR